MEETFLKITIERCNYDRLLKTKKIECYGYIPDKNIVNQIKDKFKDFRCFAFVDMALYDISQNKYYIEEINKDNGDLWFYFEDISIINRVDINEEKPILLDFPSFNATKEIDLLAMGLKRPSDIF